MTPPSTGYLFDVDGPLASPVSRTLREEGLVDDLVALARSGAPICFNTGRSDAFLRETVLPPLRAAGLPDDIILYGICEKGAVWFRSTSDALVVDEELALPSDYADEIRELVAAEFADSMFFDETKHAMVSVEQLIDVSSEDYQRERERFDARADDALARRGIGSVRLDVTRPVAGETPVRIDPTIISTDIESIRLGKDLGARRFLTLLDEDGRARPEHWVTVGDSPGDYAMARELHEAGYSVEHIDVRPVAVRAVEPFPVRLPPEGMIDDVAGAHFLREWTAALRSAH